MGSFNGLAAENSSLKKTLSPSPIITLTLTGVSAFPSTEEGLAYRVLSVAREYGVKLDESLPPSALLEELIRSLASLHGEQVVLLIDEYESPLTDSLEDLTKAAKVRDALRVFFSPINALETKIKFLFITGVLKI